MVGGARMMTTEELSQFFMSWLRLSFTATYGLDIYEVQTPMPENPYRWGDE